MDSLGPKLIQGFSITWAQNRRTDSFNSPVSSDHKEIVNIYNVMIRVSTIKVVLNKSDSDVIFCLQLLSKTLTHTLHLR